jgi:hypothetical protein
MPTRRSWRQNGGSRAPYTALLASIRARISAVRVYIQVAFRDRRAVIDFGC